MHSSLHDEAQASLASHSEMGVQEAQGPKPKVTETGWSKRSDTSKARMTWLLSCLRLASLTASRHTSVETGHATTSTGNLHLEGIWWSVVVGCTAMAGRLDHMGSAAKKANW